MALSPPKPANCPSVLAIDRTLSNLEAAWPKDSDQQSMLLDRFFAAVPTACMSKSQTLRLGALSGSAQAQAHSEEASFHVGILGALEKYAAFLALLTKAETYVRIAELVGGIILLVMGLKQFGISVPIPKVGPLAAIA